MLSYCKVGVNMLATSDWCLNEGLLATPIQFVSVTYTAIILIMFYDCKNDCGKINKYMSPSLPPSLSVPLSQNETLDRNNSFVVGQRWKNRC